LQLFFSCIPSKEPKLTIVNNSDIDYDSIKVFTTIEKPTIFYNVLIDSRVKGKILFNSKKKGDGCYKINLFNDGSLIKKECFGYYTNGASGNYSFKVMIEKDTIRIESK